MVLLLVVVVLLLLVLAAVDADVSCVLLSMTTSLMCRNCCLESGMVVDVRLLS